MVKKREEGSWEEDGSGKKLLVLSYTLTEAKIIVDKL